MSTDYQTLFSEIKKSSFIKRYPTSKGALEIYYTDQKDMLANKPTLVRTLDKNGKGKEILYSSSGRPILEVNLKYGEPYGHAKMFDEHSVRIFPNTYWYYGQELVSPWSLHHFSIYEDDEKAILEKKRRAREKVYGGKGFHAALYAYAILEGHSKPDLRLLAQKVRENTR